MTELNTSEIKYNHAEDNKPYDSFITVGHDDPTPACKFLKVLTRSRQQDIIRRLAFISHAAKFGCNKDTDLGQACEFDILVDSVEIANDLGLLDEYNEMFDELKKSFGEGNNRWMSSTLV